MTTAEYLNELYAKRKLLQWQRRWITDKQQRHDMQTEINELSDKIRDIRRLADQIETPEGNQLQAIETPETGLKGLYAFLI